ncbi:multidrug effflux MFS transporter [Microbulbifer litoralis]|uniref:multidrug effflux MFS transporter n=1 Tax=Microbulbifer litoralis TaxID=2933965 RepID=UPI00202817ED|nr:multidrug effflux MFS transporter [Microbulbifer sp. GX H0434]
MNEPSPRFGFVLLLAMTVALGPLALDTYLPAFPAMADALAVDSHALSLSISIYVFVLSLGQLIGGPLSDRLGRGPVLMAGLAIFSLASLAIWQTEDFRLLLLLRAAQAFGGGWAAVCVPALVRDRVHGREAAKLFSLIGLIVVAAPAFAPSIGSLLLELGGWTSIFLFLGLYGAILLVAQRLTLFRGPRVSPPASGVSALRRYAAVLSTRPALRFIGLQAMAFSVMLLFITHSSFIYQQHFGVGPELFAILFGANIVVMTVMMLANRIALNRFSPHRLLRFAITLQASGIAALLLVLWLAPTLWLFVPSMMITVGAMGAISPNNQASCMEYFEENGGTAAALMGALQFSVAGGVSALSAMLPETVEAIVLGMAICSAVCLLLVWAPFRDTALESQQL